MRADQFFEAADPQNIVKTSIVTNYFRAWTTIMLPQLRRPEDCLAYIDLFAGPGRFEDGSPSTPLWVLSHSIEDPRLCTRLVTVFNDKEPGLASRLQQEIASLPGVDRLKHSPHVTNVEIGLDLVNLLKGGSLFPTLFFIDPFGYKGLSIDLIGNAIKSWGCDCIFFFNYNRINPAISHQGVVERMNDLFGIGRAERLRTQVQDLSPDERQETIMSYLTEALKAVGGKHVLPFEFQSQHGDRTSHYIVFVSKAFLGYHIMKEVMWPLSTDTSDIRNFEYIPVKSTQMALFPGFGKNHSIPLLKEVLVQSAPGMRASVWDIYERFTVDTPYMLRHVQAALLELENEQKVSINPPADRRPKRNGKVTLARGKIVTFPR